MNLLTQTPHRNQLERYLRRYVPKLSGSILDIGSKNRRYDYLMKEKPTAIDLIPNPAHDVLPGDVNDLKFQSGSFDNIVCLEVLEYITTPEQAIVEMHRVLSPGGTLVVSVPFMYRPHGDMQRYTDVYLKKLLSSFQSVQVYRVGSAYTIMLDMLFSKIRGITLPFLRYAALLVYAPLALFVLEKNRREGDFASGYFIIAQK